MLQEVITRATAKEKSKGYLVTTLDIQFKCVNSPRIILSKMWENVGHNDQECSRYADRHLFQSRTDKVI